MIAVSIKHFKRFLTPPNDMAPLLIVGVICGLFASIATLFFLWLIFTIEHNATTYIGSFFGQQGMAVRLWIIAITGAIIVGQINRIFKRIGSIGPDDIILSIQARKGSIPVLSGFLSAVAAAISIASGASLGQYGPVMSLGATVGSAVSRLKLKIPHLTSISMATGVSAAITVAFHAPLTAVIFAHEVILRHFSIQAFAPIAVAAAVGEVVLNLTGERYPLFRLVEEVQPSSGNYILFILMGIVGAIIADILMTLSINVRRWVDQYRIPVWLQPIIAAVFVALIATKLPQSIGSGTQYFSTYLSGYGPNLQVLALLFFAKLLLTSTCYGMRFYGGMFGPALFEGLLFGLIVGHIAGYFGYVIEPFYVGMIGMVAVASPVIGGPIAMVIMVFELTGNYWLATSAMLAVLSSNLTSYRWLGRSYYDLLLRERGYDLTKDRAQLILKTRDITPYIKEDVVRGFKEESIATIMERLGRLNQPIAHIVNVEGQLEGLVSIPTLIACQLDDSQIGEHDPVELVMQRPEDLFHPDTTIWVAINKLRNFNGRQIVVVSRDDNELKGVIIVNDLLKAYLLLGDEINAEQTGRAIGKPV